MKKTLAGVLAASLLAAGWFAYGVFASPRAKRDVTAPIARVESRQVLSAVSRARSTEPAASAADVSQAVKDGMRDAMGDLKMRLKDRAAEQAMLQQPVQQPPGGLVLPTPEELARIHEAQQNYAEMQMQRMQEKQDE